MERGGAMKYLSMLGVVLLLVGAVACSQEQGEAVGSAGA